MSLLGYHNHHIHAFLKNKDMNEIYLSYGITNFALGLISVFEPIYLLRLNYSIPLVLLYFLLSSLGFLLFAKTGAIIVSKIGTKYSIMISMLILIFCFLGLRFLPNFPVLFFIIPFIKSLKLVLYNFSFHLNFMNHSEKRNRGKEVSMIQAVALFASLASPLLGGVIAGFLNFNFLFLTGSLLLLTAIIPLFFLKENRPMVLSADKINLKKFFSKENFPLTLNFGGYAIESWVGIVIWPIFLFVILKNIQTVGLIVTLASIATFFIFYFMGVKTDKTSKPKLIKLATVFYFFSWIGRMFVNDFNTMFLADVYKNTTQHILHIPWSAYSYDVAARSDYFNFIVRREFIFNLSRVIIIPIIILLFLINFHPFTLSFVMAAVFSIFYALLPKEKAAS